MAWQIAPRLLSKKLFDWYCPTSCKFLLNSELDSVESKFSQCRMDCYMYIPRTTVLDFVTLVTICILIFELDFNFADLELQAEEMSVYSSRSSGLHQNNILPSCKKI